MSRLPRRMAWRAALAGLGLSLALPGAAWAQQINPVAPDTSQPPNQGGALTPGNTAPGNLPPPGSVQSDVESMQPLPQTPLQRYGTNTNPDTGIAPFSSLPSSPGVGGGMDSLLPGSQGNAQTPGLGTGYLSPYDSQATSPYSSGSAVPAPYGTGSTAPGNLPSTTPYGTQVAPPPNVGGLSNPIPGMDASQVPQVAPVTPPPAPAPSTGGARGP